MKYITLMLLISLFTTLTGHLPSDVFQPPSHNPKNIYITADEVTIRGYVEIPTDGSTPNFYCYIFVNNELVRVEKYNGEKKVWE